MAEAGFPEANIEGLTIQSIIDGTNENAAWKQFRTSLSMTKEEAFPESVRELEDILMAYSGSLTTTTVETSEFRFTQGRENQAKSSDKRRAGGWKQENKGTDSNR